MKRILRLSLWLGLLGAGPAALAFSLLGPFKGGAGPGGGVADAWQAAGYGGLPDGLGYTLYNDIGGPQFLTEGYRWNVPLITYAFDESFIRYFGTNGMFAVDKAFQVLSGLPPVSEMSPELLEFPLEETREVNNTAQALGMHDLKSLVLAMMIEQLGLANSQRFVWGLRSRTIIQGVTNYTVLPMNYDPVTYRWSPYVNGVLYAYRIVDPATNSLGQSYASAVEIAVGNPYYVDKRTPLSARLHNPDLVLDDQGLDAQVPFSSTLLAGHVLTGLTRDDVGGLRFLLRSNNVVTETLLTNVIVDPASLYSPWTPIIGGITNYGTNLAGLTNIFGGAGTNATNFLRQALRPGIGKLRFQRVNYDSLLGLGFVTVTNTYTDNIITNGRAGFQKVARLIVQPDILFLSEDLGIFAQTGAPIEWTRTDCTGWINNNAINGQANQNGPGLIVPQIQVRLTDNAPFFRKVGESPFGNHLDVPFVWASFDASTNAPIIYPAHLHYTVQDIADQVLGVGDGPPFP